MQMLVLLIFFSYMGLWIFYCAIIKVSSADDNLEYVYIDPSIPYKMVGEFLWEGFFLFCRIAYLHMHLYTLSVLISREILSALEKMVSII